MSEQQLLDIAENAKFVVSGYAFTAMENGLVSILNLNHPDCAMVISRDCQIIETNMDPIEQQIVLALCRKNMQFMED